MQTRKRLLRMLAPVGIAAGLALPWMTWNPVFSGFGFVLGVVLAALARWRVWFAATSAVAGTLGVVLLLAAGARREDPVDSLVPLVALSAGVGAAGAALLRRAAGPLPAGWPLLPWGIAAVLAVPVALDGSIRAAAIGAAVLGTSLVLRGGSTPAAKASHVAPGPAVGIACAVAVMAAAAVADDRPWWVIGWLAALGLGVVLPWAADPKSLVESILAVVALFLYVPIGICAAFGFPLPTLPLLICAAVLLVTALERAITRGVAFPEAAIVPIVSLGPVALIAKTLTAL